MTEKYLRNLSDLILKEMEDKAYTIVEFADICGVSPRKISDLKNRRAKNIKLKTLVKICEAHNFSYADVFDCWEEMDDETVNAILSKFILTNGRDKFFLSRLSLK